MADLFDGLIVSCPNGGGMFLLHKGTPHKLDGFDTTGFDVRGERIVRAIQPASLVLFHASAREFAGKQANIDDLHDAFFDDDSCYVVSTRGNEIVQLDFNGEEQHRWTFPGEIDAWHVNSITRWNERIVFSAFADRTGHRAYKDPPLEVGFVQDLETGNRRITGLCQPHSLTPDGNHLLLANSGAFEVHAYDSGGKLLRRLRLDGYTRGLARQGKVLYVGLSKSRNVGTEALPGATVVALDATTWEELGRVRLPVNEIYGLKSVRGVDALATLAKIASHASARFAGDFEQTKLKLAGVERIREHLMGQFDAVTRDRDEQSRDSARRIHGLLETVHGKDIQIQNRDQIIRDKDAEIERRDGLLQAKDAEIQRRDELLSRKDAEIARRDALIRQGEKRMQGLFDKVSTLMTVVAANDAKTSEWMEVAKRNSGQIQVLTDLLYQTGARLVEIEQEGVAVRAQLAAQAREITARDLAITAIQATASWRITKPLRDVRRLGSAFVRNRVAAALLRPIRKLRHVGHTLRATFGDPERRARYLMLARMLGPRATVQHTFAYLRRGGPRPHAPIPTPVFDLRPGLGRRAVILTTPHCGFVAHSIQHALKKIGVETSIIHARPEVGYEDLPHFVICPQMFEQLPGLYVAFQMEQSVSTRWFTDAYMRMLENSFAILDYSVANVEALVEKGLHRKQFFYLPLGYLPNCAAPGDEQDDEYDVMFYGDDKNDRRQAFLDALGKVCKVKVINNLFGDALHAELAKAKLIVNIHYYEGALLETTRLWECVSFGKLVVSERAVNMAENRDLESLVDFVDLNDVHGMVERVQYWLANESARVVRLKANRETVAQQPNRFEYFFYRFLLAWDIITFHRFWELAGSKLTLAGDKLCLNLPEWFGRRQSFDKDNHYGFAVFPGLRHYRGWVGCGMSYKLMIMLARKQRMPQIVICEDDVEFREGFRADFEVVLEELSNTRSRWDVFSGLLGDLHADAKITSVRDFHGRKLVLTNKLISMVFNVYNRRIFDRVALWDERDRDVNKNTIDRYLEHTHLNVLVCHPFLVGHKGDLHSTLWGIQNGEMEAMIQCSEQLLGRKISDFFAHASA